MNRRIARRSRGIKIVLPTEKYFVGRSGFGNVITPVAIQIKNVENPEQLIEMDHSRTSTMFNIEPSKNCNINLSINTDTFSKRRLNEQSEASNDAKLKHLKKNKAPDKILEVVTSVAFKEVQLSSRSGDGDIETAQKSCKQETDSMELQHSLFSNDDSEISHSNIPAVSTVHGNFDATTNAAKSQDVIVRKRTYDGFTKKWLDWQTLLTRQGPGEISQNLYESDHQTSGTSEFELGLDGSHGTLRIFTSILNQDQLSCLTTEILKPSTCHRFRKYKVQGVDEPRIHLLFHDDATNEFQTPQPGYRHGNCFMKAQSFDGFPELHILSDLMRNFCHVPSWNCCLNVVVYRDWKDRIGFHADDEQGEKVISVINVMKSPNKVSRRRVVIRTKLEKRLEKLQHGDEQIELYLSAGDGYEMDGKMQQFYEHGVKTANLKGKCSQDNSNESALGRQISLVFRHGDFKLVQRDSGQPCLNIQPRIIHKCYIGRDMDGLNEGFLYKRQLMIANGFHRAWQQGISGNLQDGCDSIIIGERRDNICMQLDELLKFIYVAEIKNGALRIMKTALAGLPIRVFRSTTSHGRWQVQLPQQHSKSKSRLYRYDGLYKVSLHESHFLKIRQDATLSFYFRFERVPVERGNLNNEISDETFQRQCNGGLTTLSRFGSWGMECDEEKIRQLIKYGELLVRAKGGTPVQHSNTLIFRLSYEIEDDETYNAFHTLHAAELLCGLQNGQHNMKPDLKCHLMQLLNKQNKKIFQFELR